MYVYVDNIWQYSSQEAWAAVGGSERSVLSAGYQALPGVMCGTTVTPACWTST